MKRWAEPYKLWALGIAALMSAAVLAIWNAEHVQEAQREQAEIVAQADALTSAISRRFEQYQSAARGVRWFLETTERPEPSVFRSFLAALQLSAANLGAQGIGFAAYVPASQLSQHQKQWQALGRESYQVKPAGARAFYAPLVLLEPETESNRNALGFDINTNPRVINSLLASRDNGDYLLSERLNLVQDVGREPAPSYVLYAPIYRRGAALATVEERRVALAGWLSIPFRVKDFFGDLVRTPLITRPFAIYESNAQGPDTLIYLSPGLDGDSLSRHAVVQRRPVDLGGHRWNIALLSPPHAASAWALEEYSWIGLSGLAASLLIGALVWRLGSSRVVAKEETRQALASQSQTLEDYRSLLEAIPDLMFELDADGRYHQFKGPRHDLLYTDPRLFIGKTVRELLPAESAEICMSALQEAQLKGFSSGQQLQLDIGGQVHWFELSTSIKAGPQHDRRFVVLSRDITPRKKAQLELQQSEERLRLAVRGGKIGLWEWTFATGQLQVNEEWCRMLGIDAATTAIDMDYWTSLVHPDDFVRLENEVRDLVLDPKGQDFRMEIRARHKEGHYVWILDRGSVLERDESGLPVRILGSHLDISAQKLATERLNVSAHALMASPQGIVISNAVGTVISVNPAFCHITGYSEQEMIGYNCRTLQGADTDPAQVQRIRQAIQSGSGFNEDILNYRKDGTPFWNDLLITPVKENGELTHFIGVSRDVTDKKLAERQLEADRVALLESRTQLRNLSRRLQEAQENERRRVAHELHDELGQTLTALKINLQTSGRMRGQNADKALEENVRIVNEAIAQVRHLSLALRPSMLDDLGLPAALRWLASTVSVNRDVHVSFDYQADQQRFDPAVETACFRITQEALTNVRRHAKAQQVHIDLQIRNLQLQLCIQDDGQGFEPGSLAQRQASHPSLGILGMRERAASIGGSIEFISKPGQGCQVVLRCELFERNGEAG